MPLDASIYNNTRAPDVSPLMRGIEQYGQQKRAEPFQQAALGQQQQELIGKVASSTIPRVGALLDSGDAQGAMDILNAGRQQLERAGITVPPSPILKALEQGDIQTATKISSAFLQRMNMQSTPASVVDRNDLISRLPTKPDGSLKKLEEMTAAERAIAIDAGLVPRATGSAAITTATEGLTDLLAESEGAIAGEKSRASEFGKLTGQRQGDRAGLEADVEREKALARAGAEKQIAQPKIRASGLAMHNKTERLVSTIDRVLPRISALTAGPGSVFTRIPGSEARDVQADLDTIKASIGFQELQEMRDNSPTGGALGNVTERELAFLQSLWANLEQSQSPEQLRRNLLIVREATQNSWERVSDAYEQSYGEPLVRQQQGASIEDLVNQYAD